MEAARIARELQAIEEAGHRAGAWAAYREYVGAEYATREEFEDVYCGEWETFEDYAEVAEDIGLLVGVSENLRRYFALDRWARDLILGGDYWTADSAGGAWVFRS
jgi:antirestriction protein